MNKKQARDFIDHILLSSGDIDAFLTTDDCLIAGWDAREKMAYHLVEKAGVLDLYREAGMVKDKKIEYGNIRINTKEFTSGGPYLAPDVFEDFNDIEDLFKEGMGFDDDTGYCIECFTSIQTQPSFYGWTPDFWFTDDGYICGDCVRNNLDMIDEYIDHCKNRNVGCHVVDPTDYRWEVLEEENSYSKKIEPIRFQNGFHAGMDDDPQRIIKILNSKDIDVIFTFQPSQFYVDFFVYVPKGKAQEALSIIGGIR